MHNKAVCEFYMSGLTNINVFQKALNDILTQVIIIELLHTNYYVGECNTEKCKFLSYVFININNWLNNVYEYCLIADFLHIFLLKR